MDCAANGERLPAAPGAAAAFQLRDDGRRGSQGAKGVSVLAGSRRILVVDDDECMRELVRLHLANAGYEVEMAEDAVVALKSIMRRAPSLVIVDVNMPYLNGLDFVGALKADPGFRHIPVMFLTSRTDIDQRALELGAIACLKKPLLAPALVAAVAAVVPGDTIVIG